MPRSCATSALQSVVVPRRLLQQVQSISKRRPTASTVSSCRPQQFRLLGQSRRVAANAGCKAWTGSSELADERPPLAVRAGLVGATTALMTPIFPIIGFNQLVFRFLTQEQRAVIHGGTSMLYFSTMVLVPKAFYWAPVLLPFAVGNGVTAAALYVAADKALGGPQVLANLKIFGWVPFAGPLLGLSTALLVPLTYPITWNLVYPPEEGGFSMVNADVYNLICEWCYQYEPGLACLASTGLASGFILQTFLRPVILGVPGWPWQHLAGLVLALSLVGLTSLYSTSTRSQLHAKDIDLEELYSQDEGNWWYAWCLPNRVPCYINGLQECCWIPALDPTGKVVSELCVATISDAGECVLDQAYYEGGGKQMDGSRRYKRAEVLLEQVLDKHLVVYKSHRDAFFNGLMRAPVAEHEVVALAQDLPVGETIMTDALVILLSGSPEAALETAFRSLLPELRDSSLIQRLKYRESGPLARRSWVSCLSKGEEGGGLGAWREELTSRAAELRELLRLEAGAATGPLTGRELEQRLQAAGVQVRRARTALRRMKWAPDELSRGADLEVIGRLHRHRSGEYDMKKVLAAALLGGGTMLGLFALTQGA